MIYSKGRLYLSDTRNLRILVLDRNGLFLHQLGHLAEPAVSLAVDRKGDFLFVVQPKQLQVFRCADQVKVSMMVGWSRPFAHVCALLDGRFCLAIDKSLFVYAYT